MFRKAINIIIFGLVMSTFIACSSHSKKQQQDQSSKPQQTEAKKEAGKKMKTTHEVSVTDQITCVLGKDSRIIESNVLKKEKGCKLFYTKFGVKKEIASSEWSSSHCETVSERVKSNLEASGFKCSTDEDNVPSEKKTATNEKEKTSKTN